MKRDIVFGYIFKSISLIGAVILFSWSGQRIINKKNACQENTKFLKFICFVQEVNNSINHELDMFSNDFKLALEGKKNLRNGNLLSKEKFNNYRQGFEFSYLPENGSKKGYLLLSRIHPELQEPKIELWDLTKQEIIYKWPINTKLVIDQINFDKRNKNVLRFLHPLLLNDGSIITHIQPEHQNTELLKFDFCGNLIEYRADGLRYHHSIENDKEGNIYVPTATIPSRSEYFSNYESFPDNYRNEGIAILDKDLVLKEVLPLDKIFHSVGLLNYINEPDSQFKFDPYHLNDIHPYKDDNQDLNLLLSLRYFGLISYNYNKRKVNWISRGLTEKQHDITPYLGSKNTFTVFDNGSKDNHPTKSFKGNTIVKIEFSKNINQRPIILFGETPKLNNVKITRYDFTILDKELIPYTVTEGRGRFIDEYRIFIEETNNGRAFVFNINSNKLEWSYINKGKDGYTRFLGWSRYLDNIPAVFKNNVVCDS